MKTLPMWSRRRFLEIASGLPLVGGLVGADAAAAIAAPPGGARDYFRELGVRPFINAAGTYTAMTASHAELAKVIARRSEEHTSELQSRFDLVCRLRLEKKRTIRNFTHG